MENTNTSNNSVKSDIVNNIPVDLYPKGADIPNPFEVGAFLIDKQQDWTSFDVVKKLKGIVRIRKIGHAGTLDPMATGLLIICVSRPATKHIDAFMGLEKEYTGTIRLGEETLSYDAESEVVATKSADHITDEQIEEALIQFRGDIQQIPPMFSAIKIKGERLYKKARRGETVERPPRALSIYTFEITNRDGQNLDFLVRCSKGTYIRSLAHDLGAVLGVGGHLIALRRTAIGPFRADNAWTLDELSAFFAARQSENLARENQKEQEEVIEKSTDKVEDNEA